MEIGDLKKNVQESRKIILNLKKIRQNLRRANKTEVMFYSKIIDSLFNQLQILNSSIPKIIGYVTTTKKLSPETPSQKKDSSLLKVSYNSGMERKNIIIQKTDKEDYLRELNLTEKTLKKIGQTEKINLSNEPSVILKISNKIFGALAKKFEANNFRDLKKDFGESNPEMLFVSYLALSFFFSFFIFLVSILVLAVYFVVDKNALFYAWIPVVTALISFIGFYIYPSMKKSDVQKKINSELPFAIIYMSAIAGSDVEPTKIFQIIADSKEYKFVGREMQKVINQMELYGADLVVALKNIARTTLNSRLAELLNGMATNVSTGASLKNYLEKKSETMLIDYRLERERYNSLAANFMDIYISVLITAPLILIIIIVIMNVANLNFMQLSTSFLVGISLAILILANIAFLIFLKIKQPPI